MADLRCGGRRIKGRSISNCRFSPRWVVGDTPACIYHVVATLIACPDDEVLVRRL